MHAYRWRIDAFGGELTREALFQLGVLLCLTGMRAPLTDLMVPEAVMFPR